MQPLDPSGRYADDVVLRALRGVTGSRTLSYRFDRLSASNGYLGALSGVLKASVALNSLADIKRTAKFSLLDSGPLDYLKDRIQPFARLQIPGDAATYSWLGAANGSASQRIDSRTGEIRTNLVKNSSLVTGASYYGANPGVGALTAGRVLGVTPTGSAFYRATWTSAAASGAYLEYNAASSHGIYPGELYTFSSWVRSSVPLVVAPTINLFDGVAGTLYSPGANVNLPANTWTRVSVTTSAKAPAGTVGGFLDVFVVAGTIPSGGTFDMSGAILEKAATVGTFFDGSFPSLPGFVEWPLGVFLLSTPARALVGGSYVARDVEAYDQLVVLRDDKTPDRLSYPAGTLYTTAVQAIATAHSFVSNITTSALAMPSAMEWDPGTTYLRVVNDLLAAINYESASFDEVGRFVAKPYVSPTIRASAYTYATDAVSVISGDVTQTIDLFSVPNKWVLVVSEADRPPIVGTYTNSAPSSPTSTVSRGRTIVDYRTEQDAADQVTLDAKAARLAVDASQVFESVTFSTAVMPIHSTGDVFTVQISELVVDAKFSEQSWEYELAHGALMKHQARRVVNV